MSVFPTRAYGCQDPESSSRSASNDHCQSIMIGVLELSSDG